MDILVLLNQNVNQCFQRSRNSVRLNMCGREYSVKYFEPFRLLDIALYTSLLLLQRTPMYFVVLGVPPRMNFSGALCPGVIIHMTIPSFI